MKVLGIIPARGGSKSVPLKNIRKLCGKPLIAYTIESAQGASVMDKLVVSTDHEAIATVAEEYGAEVVMRPKSLSTDEAPTEWALLHVLDELRDRNSYAPDIVLTLEPTSPFRTKATIIRTVNIFDTTDADSVIGVVETRNCYGRITKDRFEFLFPGQPRRRQDREPLYKESSTIYATKSETLKRKKSVLGDRLYPMIVSDIEAIDINSPFDFDLAEFFMKTKGKEE